MSEKHIRGYAKLAAFLTKHGFRTARSTLLRWHAEGKGPPEAGWSSTAKVYDADAVLEWANAQAQEELRQRGRSKTVARPPAPLAEQLPPLVVQMPPRDDDTSCGASEERYHAP